MAAQDAQLASQKAQMESLQALLMANGLVSTPTTGDVLAGTISNSLHDTPGTPGTSGHARAQGQVGLNQNRKRHHSPQLGATAKDARIHESPHGSPLSQPLNQNAMGVQSNMPLNGQVKGTFNVSNDRQMRQELEIALESMNGEVFRGTVTRQEAKFGIYRECLGFNDFSNFDGARFGFKGCPIIIIKLVAPINVDELFNVQHFQFRRKSSRQGRTHIDVIQCKIRGIRPPGSKRGSDVNQTQEAIDEGIRIIKIDGCDYRIPEEILVQFLSHYGTLMSEVMEDLFDDGLAASGTSGGLNRTGTYSVKIKLRRDVPQILPIMGRRIRVYYKGIQKLCPNCFGPHPKHACHSSKVDWRSYVEKFMESNGDIPVDLFGNWVNSVDRPLFSNNGNKPTLRTANGPPPAAFGIGAAPHCKPCSSGVSEKPKSMMPITDPVSKTADWLNTNPILHSTAGTSSTQIPPSQILVTDNITRPLVESEKSKSNEPKQVDFLVPRTKAEHEQMIDRLIQGGSLLGEAEQIIASRKTAFNKALKEYKKNRPQSK